MVWAAPLSLAPAPPPRFGHSYTGRVADQRPPHLDADERTTLGALLQFQRESFVRKLSGVDETEAAASPVPSGTNLLWLANHVADAETTWVLERFAGEPEPAIEPHVLEVAGALLRYQELWPRVDAVVAAAGLEDECPPFDGRPVVNMRWILGHLLEEIARHAGHADILRELIDGQIGR